MICKCNCLNCEDGDHGHCEHNCSSYDLDQDDIDVIIEEENINEEADRLWSER